MLCLRDSEYIAFSGLTFFFLGKIIFDILIFPILFFLLLLNFKL